MSVSSLPVGLMLVSACCLGRPYVEGLRGPDWFFSTLHACVSFCTRIPQANDSKYCWQVDNTGQSSGSSSGAPPGLELTGESFAAGVSNNVVESTLDVVLSVRPVACSTWSRCNKSATALLFVGCQKLCVRPIWPLCTANTCHLMLLLRGAQHLTMCLSSSAPTMRWARCDSMSLRHATI